MTQEKLTKFVSDPVMANAVHQVLLDAFLKKKDRHDIHELAASRIAIDLLEDAWRELDKYKSPGQKEKKDLVQVGM